MLKKLLWVIKNGKTSSLIIFFIILNFVLMGCASKTNIKTRPEGAEVYIDNVRKGITPFQYEDTAIAGSTKTLKLKKEGYRNFDTVIRKSEFQWGPCIGGAFVLVPLIWVLGYPDEQEFALEKLPEPEKKITP